MLFDTKRIAVHRDPQKLVPGRDRIAPGGIQKGVDIVENGAGIAIRQKDKADEPPGPLEIMKSTGVQLIRQGASQRKLIHSCNSLPLGCQRIGHIGVWYLSPQRTRCRSIASMTLRESGAVVEANQSTM